jgi:hypothetical protein
LHRRGYWMHFTKIQIKFIMTCNEDKHLDATRMLKYRPNRQGQIGKPLKRLLDGPKTGLLRLNSWLKMMFANLWILAPWDFQIWTCNSWKTVHMNNPHSLWQMKDNIWWKTANISIQAPVCVGIFSEVVSPTWKFTLQEFCEIK